MLTEFTCGIYTAKFHKETNPNIWSVRVNEHMIGTIDEDGILIHFNSWSGALDEPCLLMIAVLMNDIKRQYKQHANTNNP